MKNVNRNTIIFKKLEFVYLKESKHARVHHLFLTPMWELIVALSWNKWSFYFSSTEDDPTGLSEPECSISPSYEAIFFLYQSPSDLFF